MGLIKRRLLRLPAIPYGLGKITSWHRSALKHLSKQRLAISGPISMT
jgi:hypothetical protein